MKFNISNRPCYALLEVELDPNERLVTESGAMVAKSKEVVLEPQLTTNPNPSATDKLAKIVVASLRKVIGGESFFVTHFSSASGGKVWVAPTFDGDIAHHKLNNESFYLTASAFLASVGSIDITVKWGGLRSFFSKQGIFLLEVNGTGDIWFNSFGGIEVIEVDGDYIVDNGHLVGWEPSLSYTMTRAGKGLKAMMASGEGLVCKFEGRGKVFIQTRNVFSFADWVNNFY